VSILSHQHPWPLAPSPGFSGPRKDRSARRRNIPLGRWRVRLGVPRNPLPLGNRTAIPHLHSVPVGGTPWPAAHQIPPSSRIRPSPGPRAALRQSPGSLPRRGEARPRRKAKLALQPHTDRARDTCYDRPRVPSATRLFDRNIDSRPAGPDYRTGNPLKLFCRRRGGVSRAASPERPTTMQRDAGQRVAAVSARPPGGEFRHRHPFLII